jgi:hypothetical protein
MDSREVRQWSGDRKLQMSWMLDSSLPLTGYSREVLGIEGERSKCNGSGCAEPGVSPALIDNQAAYVLGWLKKLRVIGILRLAPPPGQNTSMEVAASRSLFPSHR